SSADDQHGTVGQVDHLVRGAAEDGPGEVASAPGAHDDDVGVVLLGVREDLTRRVPEAGRPYVSFSVNARLPQSVDPVPDRLGRPLIALARHIPHLGDDLLLQQVQHPYLALGQQGQILGRGEHAVGDLRMIHSDQQSLVHQSASFASVWPLSWATPASYDAREAPADPEPLARRFRREGDPHDRPSPVPGIQSVPASGTLAIAAASMVSATRSSGSRWWTLDLPQARASAVSSMVSAFR